ncbi:hypothetical protein BOTCAL_0537g00070 [Botryotinia calthae]|uniref:Uncharacterized protein n=1 Tax=Botryotinia calthae TaxID=38488 RepID=A0A4Y8CMM0_9HELO|nr:hypothetical protein BOTCAL_0537g00070 [Botryotinia calthae]
MLLLSSAAFVLESFEALEECKTIDWRFKHGDRMWIFEDAQNKASKNYLTAYVKKDVGGIINPVHYSAFLPKYLAAWSEASHKGFDHIKTFQEGHCHNLTSQLGGKFFNNVKTLNFTTSDEKIRDQKLFTAIPIPYVAVTAEPQGKLKPEIEIGMFYTEVYESHKAVTPIFDDNITKGETYVLPKFPVEFFVPFHKLVERTPIGNFEAYGDKSFYIGIKAGECLNIPSDDEIWSSY